MATPKMPSHCFTKRPGPPRSKEGEGSERDLEDNVTPQFLLKYCRRLQQSMAQYRKEQLKTQHPQPLPSPGSQKEERGRTARPTRPPTPPLCQRPPKSKALSPSPPTSLERQFSLESKEETGTQQQKRLGRIPKKKKRRRSPWQKTTSSAKPTSHQSRDLLPHRQASDDRAKRRRTVSPPKTASPSRSSPTRTGSRCKGDVLDELERREPMAKLARLHRQYEGPLRDAEAVRTWGAQALAQRSQPLEETVFHFYTYLRALTTVEFLRFRVEGREKGYWRLGSKEAHEFWGQEPMTQLILLATLLGRESGSIKRVKDALDSQLSPESTSPTPRGPGSPLRTPPGTDTTKTSASSAAATMSERNGTRQRTTSSTSSVSRTKPSSRSPSSGTSRSPTTTRTPSSAPPLSSEATPTTSSATRKRGRRRGSRGSGSRSRKKLKNIRTPPPASSPPPTSKERLPSSPRTQRSPSSSSRSGDSGASEQRTADESTARTKDGEPSSSELQSSTEDPSGQVPSSDSSSTTPSGKCAPGGSSTAAKETSSASQQTSTPPQETAPAPRNVSPPTANSTSEKDSKGEESVPMDTASTGDKLAIPEGKSPTSLSSSQPEPTSRPSPPSTTSSSKDCNSDSWTHSRARRDAGLPGYDTSPPVLEVSKHRSDRTVESPSALLAEEVVPEAAGGREEPEEKTTYSPEEVNALLKDDE